MRVSSLDEIPLESLIECKDDSLSELQARIKVEQWQTDKRGEYGWSKSNNLAIDERGENEWDGAGGTRTVIYHPNQTSAALDERWRLSLKCSSSPYTIILGFKLG